MAERLWASEKYCKARNQYEEDELGGELEEVK